MLHSSHVSTQPLTPANVSQSKTWATIPDYIFAVYAFVLSTGAFTDFGLVGPSLALLYSSFILLFTLTTIRQGWPIKLTIPTLIVFAFPALALASTFWSEGPEITLRHSIQLTATSLFGFYIGAKLGLGGTLKALGIAMWICLLVSLFTMPLDVVSSWDQSDYAGAPFYLTGIYDQKNALGYVISLSAFTLLLASLHYGRIAVAVALLIMLALIPALAANKSSTASILYVMIILFLPFILTLRFTRSLVLTILIGITAIIGTVFILGLAGTTPVELALGAVGKDASLTGRTAIWSVAAERFSDAPLLGTGYQSFWDDPAYSPLVEKIQAYVLESITNFHNAIIETAVGLGIVGVIVLTMGYISVSVGAIKHLLAADGAESYLVPAAVFWCLLMLGARSFVEATLYFQHRIDFHLLAAFSAALGRRQLLANKNV